MMQGVRDQVVLLRKQNPRIRATEIAREVDVSRERVRQILKSERLCTSVRQQKYYCLQCGQPTKTSRCKKFCSWRCYKTYSKIPVVCPVCSKLFYREKSQVLKYAHNYCSARCLGKTQGKLHGFGSKKKEINNAT